MSRQAGALDAGTRAGLTPQTMHEPPPAGAQPAPLMAEREGKNLTGKRLRAGFFSPFPACRRRGIAGAGGGAWFMNIRKTMYKLQTAINLSGRRVRINQIQSWSETLQRMVTKYVILENGKTVLETYRAADAVKTLADMLGGG